MPESPADPRTAERDAMVAMQIAERGVTDANVLGAMRSVPRHRFVPDDLQSHAYDDGPLAIGHGQTISQPYIVALMTELARLTPSSRVLEVGTGCGYQTAVLATLAADVWSVELEPTLSARAAETLSSLSIRNVRLRIGDGSLGWPEAAPFDAIVVTAAPADTPPALIDQLAMGGRLVIPVGTSWQQLWVVARTPEGITREPGIGVRFVPLR